MDIWPDPIPARSTCIAWVVSLLDFFSSYDTQLRCTNVEYHWRDDGRGGCKGEVSRHARERGIAAIFYQHCILGGTVITGVSSDNRRGRRGSVHMGIRKGNLICPRCLGVIISISR